MHLNPGFSIKHVALASSFTSWCLSFPICKLQTICFSYAIGLLQGLNKSVYKALWWVPGREQGLYKCLPFLSLREVLTEDRLQLEDCQVETWQMSKSWPDKEQGKDALGRGNSVCEGWLQGGAARWRLWIWEAGSRVGDGGEEVGENHSSQGLRSCEDLEL